MLGDLLLAARDAAVTALASAGRPPPERIVIAQGETPWDACSILYVVLVRTYPSSTFPTEDVGVSLPCGPYPFAAQVGVGITRCVALPSETGEPPSEDQVTNESLGLVDDTQALANVLGSPDWWRPGIYDVVLAGADWAIPSGGISQGLVSLLVEYEWLSGADS